MFTKRSALVLLAVVLTGCTVHVRGPSDQVAYDWSESEAYNKPFAPSPQYVAALEATAAPEAGAAFAPAEKASAPAATRAKEVPEGEVLASVLLPKPERATVDVDISAAGVSSPVPAPLPAARPAPRSAPRPAARPIPSSQSTAPGGAAPDHG